jgi:hypothetical protein
MPPHKKGPNPDQRKRAFSYSSNPPQVKVKGKKKNKINKIARE